MACFWYFLRIFSAMNVGVLHLQGEIYASCVPEFYSILFVFQSRIALNKIGSFCNCTVHFFVTLNGTWPRLDQVRFSRASSFWGVCIGYDSIFSIQRSAEENSIVLDFFSECKFWSITPLATPEEQMLRVTAAEGFIVYVTRRKAQYHLKSLKF